MKLTAHVVAQQEGAQGIFPPGVTPPANAQHTVVVRFPSQEVVRFAIDATDIDKYPLGKDITVEITP